MDEAARLLERPGELVFTRLFGDWWIIHEGLDDERACELFLAVAVSHHAYYHGGRVQRRCRRG